MHNINNNNVVQSTSTPTTTATTRVNTTQACAACKYQRRKCAPDCILAPYFPHDRRRQFLNAHKLFGVSNITKIIRNLDQLEKDAAMTTIIFQSDVRAADPVGGCYRIIRQLQRQIDYKKAELEFLLHQLALCRAAQAQVQNHHQQPVIVAPDDDDDDDNRGSSRANNSDVNNIFGMEALGLESSSSAETVNYQQYFQPYHHNPYEELQQYQYMMMINDQNNDNANASSTMANSWGATMQSTATKEPQQRNNDIIQERNDNSAVFKPLLFDSLSDDPDQNFRLESEPTIEQSEEHITLKNHQVSFRAEDESSSHCSVAGDQHPHDLKGAATIFGLTKCNT